VLAERILKEALSRYPKAVDKFGPDGAYCEGPGYWGYAMKSAVPALSVLETALGTDFGMTKIAGFSKASLFFVSMGGANASSFNYADAIAGKTRAIELFWLADKFNQPEITEMQKQYALEQQKKGSYQQSPLELLWYKPQKVILSKLIPDNYYRVAEIASLRSKWMDNDAWFVAFKAGENGVNHGHLDIGNYVLDNQGERWIVDLGYENYNVPGYFGDVVKNGQRWTYYRTRAEGHNLLVINPDSKDDQEVDAKTKIVNFKSTPEKAFGIMDITEAYRGKATSVKRGIALINRNSALVQDEIVSDKKMDLYWFVHTPAKITLSANKRTAILEIKGKKLLAEIVSPKNGKFEMMDAKPLSTSPQPTQNNKNEGFKKLAIHIVGESNVTIAVEYKGVDKTDRQKVIPLAKW
jgi:hypothetical protein